MTNSSDCQPLLELATPTLYRRNLFRVLDMSVKDTPADVRRRQKRLEKMRKLGMAESDDQGRYFALTPPPSEEDNRSALECLSDSQTRLIDEIFWFWPIGNSVANDPALQALAQGQIEQAIEIWTGQTGDNSQDRLRHITSPCWITSSRWIMRHDLLPRTLAITKNSS